MSFQPIDRNFVAESASLEETEAGYVLVLDCENVMVRVNVQGCLEDMLVGYEQIAAYFREGDAARFSVRVDDVTAEDLEVAGKPSLEGWEQ